MSDSGKITGNRDDLVIDASRCLRMRFCDSSCRRCADICPHEAVSLDSGLAINPSRCHGCLLCTAVCPVGALEQNIDFSACLAKFTKIPEPVLGCIRTMNYSNATLACLGGLSEEHLLALFHTLSGKLVLNLSLCADCPNSSMVIYLKQRLDTLSDAKLSCSNCRIEIAESAQDIYCRDESFDRRSFFKSFGKAFFKSAEIFISTSHGQPEVHTDYAVKRLPYRRELLRRTRDMFSTELEIQARKHFDATVAFENFCTKCQGCASICPTGALQTEANECLPVFDQLLCTGCGLCQEFCLDMALRISSVNS